MGGQGDGVVVERDVPVGTVHTVAAVLSVSVGSGFVAFVGVGLVALACSWPVKLPLAGAGIVVLVVWALTVSKWYSLFWASETVRPADQVQADQVTRSVVAVELRQEGRWTFGDLSATPEQMSALARGLLAGRPFSEGEWGGTFTRPEYRALRAELVDRGLLAWRNPAHPQQGTQLTLGGRQVFRRLSEDLALPRASACVDQEARVALPSGEG